MRRHAVPACVTPAATCADGLSDEPPGAHPQCRSSARGVQRPRRRGGVPYHCDSGTLCERGLAVKVRRGSRWRRPRTRSGCPVALRATAGRAPTLSALCTNPLQGVPGLGSLDTESWAVPEGFATLAALGLLAAAPRAAPRSRWRGVASAGMAMLPGGVQGLGTLRSPRGPGRRLDGLGGRRAARRAADSVAAWSSRGTEERGELFGTRYRIPKRCHARSMIDVTVQVRVDVILRTNRGSPRRGAAESEWSRAPG